MMETLGDKERKVQLAAENAINAFRDMLGDSASMLSLLPALTASFGATKFKTQISALNFVAHIARTFPKLVGNHMIFLVPAIEAIVAGLPVVAFARGALPETVGGAGILLPDKAPSIVAEAVLIATGDPSVRSAMAAARPGHLAELAPEAVAARLRAVSKSLL